MDSAKNAFAGQRVSATKGGHGADAETGTAHGGKRIITVAGDIKPEELGFCQPHEHLYIEGGPASEIFPQLCIDDLYRTVLDLRAYKKAGGSAIADAQPTFTGRNAESLYKLSKECGVHVIAATGFHKLFYYGEGGAGNPFLELGEMELAKIFADEIRVGMYASPFYEDSRADGGDRSCDSGCIERCGGSGGSSGGERYGDSSGSGGSGGGERYDDSGGIDRTAYRAGFIKTALEPVFTELHAKLFSAAARASADTGVAIMIHVDKGADPLRIAGFLAERGVKPERTIFCHLDRAVPDAGLHRELAEWGAYIEYDTITRDGYHSDAEEARLIRGMISCGHADRLMLSLDVTRKRLRGYGGQIGLDHMIKNFIPYLGTDWMCAEITQKLFTKNPAKAFAI
ncbi:MAG: hypothetical protein LBG82_07320 [Clostridiales Family XIII bacterium]|nr:hypothetical protein [Clostridiales Family XIII bacterium]